MAILTYLPVWIQIRIQYNTEKNEIENSDMGKIQQYAS